MINEETALIERIAAAFPSIPAHIVALTKAG